ncbi:1,4-alpha-glucan-branching enzyme [Ancylomarina salipaludis]|uniref:1,4-alpha-glucan branching enzyme n=1 Tax=Ancylomarina salipaludis TaxID=2501299 RepID=A0A4Q1JPL6_9BACT|nr:alpha amylase C-terminal domain-containing protein [Ancylomarina salipaludis]RXQ96215.1 1,4-alpha-glucan-branching enzyme [Ancylomarina salipaludis]
MPPTLKLINTDPLLENYQLKIEGRKIAAEQKERELLQGSDSLTDFANGYLFFGLHLTDYGWILREWAPHATQIYLVGELNNWQDSDEFAFTRKEHGVWELALAAEVLHHGDLYRLSVYWESGHGHRLPAYVTRVVQDLETLVFSAQVWQPKTNFIWRNTGRISKQKSPLIYEAHVGMATEEEKVGSFNEFRHNVLPRIRKAGYNTIQLMAVQEHPYYGSFGYHVSNYFAVSSRFGTPTDLKALIDEAHGMGMRVIIDLVHSHSVKNENEGLGNFDGSGHQYFHEGARRNHQAWDSLCFDYGKNEVLHFLLSNIKYWMSEFHCDGFRFDGVTSMLYLNHGLNCDFISYDMYFDGKQDEDAIVYLALANKLMKQINPNSISIAEEMSGYPGLAAPIPDGGLGFDYRLAMGIPDYWIKLIKDVKEEDWRVGDIFFALSNKRVEEKTISYAESHDQALVGDKTIIFRLIDKAIYWNMHKGSQCIEVERGIALYKMIRLITIASSGGAYLNFMGNEFGHPEWIDFPRQGNNWSYKYARRQWSLADNKELRFESLNNFDQAMIQLIDNKIELNKSLPESILQDETHKVLAFYRDNLLFVFNFNPTVSCFDYEIPVRPGKYKLILSSDAEVFGGFGRVDASQLYYSKTSFPMAKIQMLSLYVPSRCALVFESIPSKRVI